MYPVYLLIAAIVWLAGIFLCWRSGKLTVYHPAVHYAFFHGLVFVVRPIIGYFLGYTMVYDLYQFIPDYYTKSTVIIASTIGYVVFVLVSLRVGNAPVSLKPTAGEAVDTQRLFRWPLLITAILLAPVAIFSQIRQISEQAAGTTTMRFDMDTGTSINTTSNGYFADAPNMLVALTVLIAWQYRFRPLAMVPFLLFFVSRVLSGNARWSFLLSTVALGLLYLYDNRRRLPTIRIMLIGVGVLSLFSVVGTQRDIVLALYTGKPIAQVDAGQKFMEGMDFANMEYFEYLVHVVPSKSGTYGYFTDNSQVLTEPIPRVLWPGKPIGAPIQLIDFYHYGFPVGMTSSVPGEGWVQLGYAGVILWSALFAWTLGKFFNWFMDGEQSAFTVSLFMLITAMEVQLFRDGILMSVLKFSLFFVIVLVTWKTISISMKPERPIGSPMPVSGRE